MPNPLQPRRRVRRVDSMAKNTSHQAARRPVSPVSAPVFVYSKQRPAQKKRRIFKVGLKSLGIATVALVVLVGGFVLLHSSGKFSLTKIAVSTVKAVLASTVTLKGQDQNRTNFVIYGMTKDGLRTDSIMLASYYYKEKKLVTVNIPRDLYVYDGYQNDKMGEVYAYAKDRQKKTGIAPQDYVTSVISKEYGIPVHYWVQFNMQGEVNLINSIGGVDIIAPDAFTDYQYPNWDYTGYIRPAPHFNAGLQHMNGDTALIYSRSRHSLDNNEGTDFARSKRQTMVLQAIMTKAKSLGLIGNVGQISHYLTILGNNVNTSMTTDEMVAFAAIAKNLNPTQDYSSGNWATGNGFLCDSTSSYGAYITLYGVPGDCYSQAGVKATSKYRQLAQYYVQHMLESVGLAPTDFVTAANSALYPKTATTTAPTH